MFVLHLAGTSKHDLHYRREAEVNTTLEELLLYFVFLINLCILTFGMVNPHMYYLNKVMSSLFVDTSLPNDDRSSFRSIRSITDFWKFMEGPLLEGLYWDSWYNNQQLYNLKNSSRIYYENILLGVPRVRQLRVRNNTCKVYSAFQSLVSDCYGKYTAENEDLSDFGLKSDTEWKYSPSPANAPWHWGYVGGLLTSWQLYSVKLLRYVTHYDYFIASCEIIFCIFLFVFITQELRKLNEFKIAYFKSIWNWLELLLLALCFLAVSFYAYCNLQSFILLGRLLKNTENYPDFYFLAYWQIYYNNMIAITIFFAWIKIFKFISFNETMSQLSSTLSRCMKDIVGFAVMFFIIFSAYAQLGFLVFGSQVDDFSTFQNSIFAQFRIVLGDFNFSGIQQANWILGPIYFITFIFFVFFVLLNMFLAIINDTYSEVKADYSIGRRPDFELGKIIKKEIQGAEQMKTWKERLEKKYYSTDLQDDDYQPVTQQEFRE
ncbi:Polycystic kidney disease 2-like 2 protein [Microtus ochrogaster]|uniref:Polycystic kidney disease 2-like 2 protein n=1 Tax=Microtus ochrogaster TaxID=79684 RepID=A0A8J6KWT9_MICOH|nr:Polycystic kidney disease 2-like 2 protein [Microtus ochrogaster]